MSLGKKLAKVVASAVLSLGMLSAIGGSVSACDYGYHTVYVTSYVTRQVPYTAYVTLYDSCGRPYQAAQTCYHTITVPVQRLVTVAY
ncbi:MAG TPA: hypothetical protein VFE24_03635 [Pirellulales bacterium]|jgi:hypothetical protein|nr:hypothetical protein [Pirellulales bacterium]